MFKRAAALFLALVTVLALLPACPARADEENILVLSDTEGDAAMEASMEYLRRLMVYTNCKVTYEDAWKDIDDVSGYTSVIVLVEEERPMSEVTAWAIRQSGVKTFVIGAGGLAQLADRVKWHAGSIVIRWEDGGAFTGDLLGSSDGVWMMPGPGESLGGQLFVDGETYPLCKTVGQITHLACFDASNDALCAALATMIQTWQWPYENLPTAYGSYLVLDCVYPFYEPAELMKITDMLDEEGVPYALSLMPVFDNAEFPAMKRFCEYLRYLQARGVGMILHMPQITLAQVDPAELVRHVEIAYDAYAMYGVYPTALQAGESYLLCEKGIELLKNFRTIFLFRNDEPIEGAPLSTNVARKDGHQVIAAAWDDMRAFTTSFAQAIYLDVNQDVEELRAYVQRIKASRRALKNLTQMETSLYLSDSYIVRGEQGLIINGELADLSYVPFTYEDDFRYDRGFAQYLTEQIVTSNKLILIFVMVACTLFITFTVLSRRIMRRDLVTGMKKAQQKPKNTQSTQGGTQEVDHG